MTDYQLIKLYFCKRDNVGRPVDPRESGIKVPPKRRLSMAEAKAAFLRAVMDRPGVKRADALAAWEAHLAKKKAKREGKTP